MRQEEIVKNHLLNQHSLSTAEARTVYKIQDLPKRISVLKQEQALEREGYRIVTDIKADATGTRYARYSIELLDQQKAAA